MTSLRPHLEYVGGLEGDFLALQETRLTQDGFNYVSDDIRRLGWSPCWGRAQPRQAGCKSVLKAVPGGVGVLVRNHHLVSYTPRTELGQSLYQTGRWVGTTVQVAGGNQLVHVISFYGISGANEGGDAMLRNESLLQQVFDESSSLGDVPVVLCGDFNVKPEKSRVITTELLAGRWLDAAATIARIEGTTPADTFFSRGTCSRIDLMLLNNRAAQLLHSCKVLPVPADGIRNHKPVQMVMRLPDSSEWAERIPRARGLPVVPPELRLSDETKEHIATDIKAKEGLAFYKKYEAGDIDGLWADWCSIAERYLLEVVAMANGQPEILEDTDFQGRGYCSETVRTRVNRRAGDIGAAILDPKKQHLLKVLAILDQIIEGETRCCLDRTNPSHR